MILDVAVWTKPDEEQIVIPLQLAVALVREFERLDNPTKHPNLGETDEDIVNELADAHGGFDCGIGSITVLRGHEAHKRWHTEADHWVRLLAMDYHTVSFDIGFKRDLELKMVSDLLLWSHIQTFAPEVPR